MSDPIVSRETPTTVAIIAGGLTHERDISLQSAHNAAKALQLGGYSTVVLEPNQNLLAELHRRQPTLVWPLVHGGIGENGALQTVLEMLGIPYVGTGPNGSRMAFSKPQAKNAIAQAGLATPRSVTVPRALFSQLGAGELVNLIANTLTFPLMVKPAEGGSSLGVSYVQSNTELRSALVEAFAYGDCALIEQFITGRDIAVSVVDTGEGMRALPPVEVTTESGRYDFDARYLAGRSVFYTPPRLPDDVLARCIDAATHCAEVLRMRDIARIDLIVDAEGTAWFIDANVSPGMTDMSLFPQAAAEHSSFAEVLVAVIQQVLGSQTGD